MPSQEKAFIGELAPVAWEAIERRWEVKRDEDGNLLIQADEEYALCHVVRHYCALSNSALGINICEPTFTVVASVPVVDAVSLSRDLLVEINLWANGREVPIGNPQVTPVHRPDLLDEEAVRVTVEYRVAGAGFRPEEVAGVLADIFSEVEELRETLKSRFGGMVRPPSCISDYDVQLTTELAGGEGEVVGMPEARERQLALFDEPVVRWQRHNSPVLPEQYRELYQLAEKMAEEHDLEDCTPLMLAKVCALRDPGYFQEHFDEKAFRRLMTLSRDELNRGSAWNVRHLLRRAANRHDPTAEIIPYVIMEFTRLLPEVFEPILDGDDGQPGPTHAGKGGDAGVKLPNPEDFRATGKFRDAVNDYFVAREDGKKGDGDAREAKPLNRAVLEHALKDRVKGQDEVAAAVASRLAMSFRGLNGKSPRPKGVFLFAGPTGVGKTEMAKAIADTVYAEGDNLIRLDMSEYRERHATARLVGPPPGYVGHNEPAGWLTTKLIANPRCVVLLDEFEKADESVWQTFLQVFEDGRLTDGKGNTADFSQAVVVLTTNLGAREAAAKATGFGQALESPAAVQAEASRVLNRKLRDTLPPELFNRLDGVFAFQALDEELLVEIARTKLRKVGAELAEAGYHLSFTPAVVRAIAKFEADPALGARPVLRAIDKLIREPLVDLEPGGYRVRVSNGTVQFSECFRAVSPSGT